MPTADQIIAIRKKDPRKSPATIADELNVSRQYVSKVLREANLPSDFRGVLPARKVSKEPKLLSDFGRITRLLGLDNEAAAALLGVHLVTLSKYAHGAIQAPEAAQVERGWQQRRP